MTRTIADLRVAIDALDKQLLHTLNQRAALANEVGDIKRKEGSQIFRPEREALGITQVFRSAITRSDQGGYGAFSPADVVLPVARRASQLEPR